jgi:hypothetical protein
MPRQNHLLIRPEIRAFVRRSRAIFKRHKPFQATLRAAKCPAHLALSMSGSHSSLVAYILINRAEPLYNSGAAPLAFAMSVACYEEDVRIEPGTRELPSGHGLQFAQISRSRPS